MKQILFTAIRQAELVDVMMPCAAPGKAVVRLTRSTISSGTERAKVIGDPSISYAKEKSVVFPRQCGYSSCGTVEELGEGVTGLSRGDRVAMSWSLHSEYVSLDQNNIYKLPDSVSDSAGALIHIGTFSLAAVRKAKVEIGESAIVMGLGVLGLAAVQLLKIAGAAPVIAVDPDSLRRERAIKLGADFALDPFEENFTERALSLTNNGANVGIEVTGNGQALDQLLDCMARFGRISLLGCTRNSDFTIDYYRKVHAPGISLIGAHTAARPKTESSRDMWTQRDDALALIRLHELGRIDFSELIEETRSPVECPEIYRRLCDERSFPVTQFDWNKLTY